MCVCFIPLLFVPFVHYFCQDPLKDQIVSSLPSSSKMQLLCGLVPLLPCYFFCLIPFSLYCCFYHLPIDWNGILFFSLFGVYQNYALEVTCGTLTVGVSVCFLLFLLLYHTHFLGKKDGYANFRYLRSFTQIFPFNLAVVREWTKPRHVTGNEISIPQTCWAFRPVLVK